MAGKSAWSDPRLSLVVAVAVGLWVPLARLQWFWGHEQYSYVVRTVEWAAELRAGELYPRWSPDLYGGYGSPFFVFFAPVTYALAGFLSATWLTPFEGLKAVGLFGSILSGLSVYALVYGETRQRDAALLGALAYLGAPYRIGNMYDRGDFGEFTCIALLPLVIALYRGAALDPRPLRARWFAAGASVLHAVVVMTHPVLGLWSTALIGLIVGATAIRLFFVRAWRRALLLVFAVACAPGVAGIYVLPAMVYRDSAQTARMVIGFYRAQDHWLPLKTLFVEYTWLFNRNFLQVGQLAAAAGIVAILAVLVKGRRGLAAWPWMAIVLLLVFLNMKEASGFWAPDRLPLTKFTQFPFRLLGLVALFSSLALGVAMAPLWERLSPSLRTSIAVGAAATYFFVISWPYPSAREMPYAGIPADPESVRQGIHAASDANEFLPAGAPVPGATRRELVAGTDGATVEYSFSDGSRHAIEARAKHRGARLRLALHGFDGWQVDTVSGPADATLETDRQAHIVLRLPSPGEYRLRLHFGGTLASRLGTFLSVVSLLALGAMVSHGSRFWPGRLTLRRFAPRTA
ncbi:MAG TPA: hypothetical protein VF103_05070 [Polyangiaceae bacterium]